MIFSYVRYIVEPSAIIPSGVISRPEIPIRIIGPKGSAHVTALLDTGADHVCLPLSLLSLIGGGLDDDAGYAHGAGGQSIVIWSGEVELELAAGGESYRWRVPVGFLETDDDQSPAYLGHVGFLEHFEALFDGEKETVELLPNLHFRESR